MEAPVGAETNVEREIQRLQSEYWARVDFLDPRPPEELFTADSEFHLGSLVLKGRGDLGAFFRQRRETSVANGRTTRHLSANLRVSSLGAGRAIASTTVLVMTGYGGFPIESGAPSIGDFEDICVLGADGQWLFERRKATSIFAGPDAPSFARAAPGDDEQGGR